MFSSEKRKCSAAKALIFSVVSAWAASASSAPDIQSVDAVSVGGIAQDSPIRVIGDGFGAKKSASPVLYDMGEVTYENGVLNSLYSALNSDTLVKSLVGDSDAPWTKIGNLPTLTKSVSGRTQYSKGHYVFDGANGFLGWPKAYGGSNTPIGNKKLYLSWWYKPAVDPVKYWRWSLASVSGSFKGRSGAGTLGEELVFSNGLTGSVIRQDGNELHFVIDQKASSAMLDQVTITGKTSGAKAKLSKSNSYVSPGSNKFVRIWSEPTGKEGLRMSWTQMHLTYATGAGHDVPDWKETKLNVNEWNHMELYLDLVSGQIVTRVNGDVLHNQVLEDVRLASEGHSPTVALIGFNGKDQTYQRTEFGEIYMDTTPQRVVVGDAPKWSDVKHYEVQYPVAWSDGEIEFKFNNGGLDAGEKYVYVFDANNMVNPTGYKLCRECKAPPVAPLLKIGGVN